ncbi:12598_t:CDS:2 [Acaulospora colombiana]|uniref:12598_t:CDS:1 n=1 Tax=Acaulospora colombiana TaxID=27376 RepID=A0ACA9LFU8_9GLOM|nr:12598_t:CDS:2 [Acaulospora colombiana]
MSTNPSAGPPVGNLRPLSLTQRPLQLRSQLSSNNSSSTNLNAKLADAANDDRFSRSPEENKPDERAPESPLASAAAVNPALQRHQKRYSTLSYTNGSRSPSTPLGSRSFIQDRSNDGHDTYDNQTNSPSRASQTLESSLSRSNSASGISSNRYNVESSRLNRHTKRTIIHPGISEPSTPSDVNPSTSSDRDQPNSAYPREHSADERETLSEFGPETVMEANSVLTLVEQYEAKCLELRSQLSQQEAELKALKTRWTNIVQEANPRMKVFNASQPSSLTRASAAVIREGVSKLFGNVTAPLAAALEALESTSEKRHSISIANSAPFTDTTSTPAADAILERKRIHCHAYTSSNQSSASSFAQSRYSMSSNSSLGGHTITSEGDPRIREISDKTAEMMRRSEDGSGAISSITSPTGQALRRRSLLVELSNNPEASQRKGTPPISDSIPPVAGPFIPSTSWTAAWSGLDGIGLPSPSTLNKKWDELQKAETSFINTFAPPLNEPIPKSKPRLTSQSSVQPSERPQISTQISSASLLDEDNEDDLLGTTGVSSTQIMQPITSSPKPASPLPPDVSSNGKVTTSKTNPKEDDVWNW